MAPWTLHLESAARFVVAIMFNSLWEDALLVFAVWLLLRTMREVNASTRYFSWLLTMIAALLLPVITTIPQTTFQQTASAQAATRVPVVVKHGISPRVPRSAATHIGPATAALTTVAPAAVPRFRTPDRLRLHVPSWLATLLFCAWLLIALVIGGRLVFDLYLLERLKRDSLPLPVQFRDTMEEWVNAAYGNARDVRICVSDKIEVPVAVGLFDSMILLPQHLLDELSAGELDRISLHELAHLHRRDDWTNSVQRFAQTVLFFNPAIRFIGSHLDLEREVACDDWVLSRTGDVRPYATCLTRMAELTAWPHRPLAAPGVFVTRKGISVRIERLLNKRRNTRVAVSYGVPVVVAGALAAFFVLANGITPVIAYTTESAAATVATVQRHVIAVTSLKHKQVELPPPPALSAHAAALAHPVIGLTSASPLAPPNRTGKLARPPQAVHFAHPPHIVHLAHPPIPFPRAPLAAHWHSSMQASARDSIDIPEINVHVPGQDINVHVPEINVHVPGRHMMIPTEGIASASTAASAAASAHMAAAFSRGFSCTGCSFKGVDWSGKDLSGRSFSGADFSHANLSGTNFSHAHLVGADFNHATLRNANFSGAVLSGCDLEGADVTGAHFDGAHITGCGGVNARSLDQDQLRTWLTGCSGCDFNHADFHGMDLRGIHSSGSDFAHANFTGADLSGARFSGADFDGADLTGANVRGAQFSGCDFNRTTLRNVDLSNVNMNGSDLSEAILR